MRDAAYIRIDAAGRMLAETRDDRRRLVSRVGRWRLLPSSGDLLVAQKVEVSEGADPEDRTAIALAGDVQACSGLVDIISLIDTSRWSGTLAVSRADMQRALCFRRGDVVLAASNLPEDRLGSILYRYGRISEEELGQALHEVTAERRLGHVLFERGLLTMHELYKYVRLQVQEIFYAILLMRLGEFYFYRELDEARLPSRLNLPTKNLLFEGVQRIDEMGQFRKQLPAEAVLARRGPEPLRGLDEHETCLLRLVDGVRDLLALARDSHLGEFEATRAAYRLLQAGHVVVRPAAAAEKVSPGGELAEAVLARYNLAFEAVYAAAAGRGREAPLGRSLESFFHGAGDYAPLFRGVTPDGAGRVPATVILANLVKIEAASQDSYLRAGLEELLAYQLFSIGELLPPEDQMALTRTVEITVGRRESSEGRAGARPAAPSFRPAPAAR